ncbi:GPI transamidase component PIG-S protein [Rutstroemia sp. NJR-2017a BVV2]|nr:GPI transamidase component PIG-S protein [Rutstroemia sp. NJR-2017a BVV2]
MRHTQLSRRLLLAAVCLATTACASVNSIFERSTCPDPSYTQCSNAGLPSGFCCPSTSTCIPLAQNTTLLCCPSGNDCTTVQPITCDISTQNITAHPDNTLKTTALTATLSKCGNACCPFGYSCSNGNCVINEDQRDSVPGQTVSSSALATSSSASTKPSGASTAVGISATISSNPSPTSASSASSFTSTPIAINPISPTCDKFPVGAILAGLFSGIVIGILLTLLAFCLIRACRRRNDRNKDSPDFGNISEPVPTSDMRTDFLRKNPTTPSSLAGTTPRRTDTKTRIRSMFRKSTASTAPPMGMGITYLDSPAPPVPLNIQHKPKIVENQNPSARKRSEVAHIHRQPSFTDNRPVTPPLQRELSYEDINIFVGGETATALRAQAGPGAMHLGVPGQADGNGRRGSHQTTFTDMMEESGLAGLRKGQRMYARGEEDVFVDRI